MHKNINATTAAYLALCGDLIAEKMGKAEISNWPNSDYQRLSHAIWKENKVRLSADTLKRIFGKVKTGEQYAPYVATLDILAVFLNYKDWQEFKAKNQVQESQMGIHLETAPVELGKESRSSAPKRYTNKGLYIAAALILFLGGLSFILWQNGRAYQKIRILCKKPANNNLNSVPFELKFPSGFKGQDSLLLDFDDGEQLRLNVGKRKIIHYYQVPGRYRVRLTHNEKPVDSIIVIVKSKGWFAYARVDKPIKRFPLMDFDGSIESMAKVNNKAMSRIGVDTLRQFSLNFANFKKTHISGDNFELVTKVRTQDNSKSVECGQVFILVLGETERHLISVVNHSCTALAAAYFSEQRKHGETSDLSTLGHDLNNGGTLKLIVKNKQVRFFLNDSQIYATAYHKPIGEVFGVRVFFSGVGKLQSFSLKDLNTGVAF